jgi:phasin family protein
MTRFSDQLTAVRQAQLEAQLDMFRTLTTRALDSAGQIAALNVRTTRASMEQAAGTMKHLLEAREPRDLFALGSAAQDQWHTLFSYGRELFGLAVGTRTAPTVNLPTSYTQAMEQVSIATADATTVTSEIAAAAADTGAALAEAAIETAIADDVPPAEPKAVAKALNEVAPKPAAAEHPIASTVALQADGEVELPAIAPLENVARPPKASRGPRARK